MTERNFLMESYIPVDLNKPLTWNINLVSFLGFTVTYKDSLLTRGFQFGSFLLGYMNVHRTPKDPQMTHCRFHTCKLFFLSLIPQNKVRASVLEIDYCPSSLCPK